MKNKKPYRDKVTSRPASLLVYLFIVVILNAYVLNKYRVGETELKKISFNTTLPAKQVVVYLKPLHASDVDFSKPLISSSQTPSLTFIADAKSRNLRLYIGEKTDTATMGELTLSYESHTEKVSLDALKKNNIHTIKKTSDQGSTFFSGESNGYFELKYDRITFSELVLTEVLIVLLSILLAWLTLLSFKNFLSFLVDSFNIRIFVVSAFIASIMLPIPVFNVLFIVSAAFIIRDFSYEKFISNKGGLLFILYFLVFLFNSFFVSSTFNGKFLETLLPIICLPVYFACVPKANYFKIFAAEAILMSLYFFSGSLIDATITQSIKHFSFDGFTKYLHPVYFSYLLFFAILVLELSRDKVNHKIVFLSVLFLALVCCGSKLIILLTILFYVARFLKTKFYPGLGFVAVLIFSIFIFSPTRTRFIEISDIKSLGILKERPVNKTNGQHLTGLTVRLIIWQESLDELSNFKSIVFGKGIDKSADKLLEDRLIARGLESNHLKYDPHNQFIATFYKTGIIGLLILILICYNYYYLASKQNNKFLFYTVMLFSVAMLTESVLQRVWGIYFFIVILLLQPFLLTSSSPELENSDTWNTRNSE